MSPIRRRVLATSACASPSAVSGALTSEKPTGSLLIANPHEQRESSYGNVRKSRVYGKELFRCTEKSGAVHYLSFGSAPLEVLFHHAGTSASPDHVLPRAPRNTSVLSFCCAMRACSRRETEGLSCQRGAKCERVLMGSRVRHVHEGGTRHSRC